LIIGYGRVSAKDKNPELQLVKFRELGIEDRYIFIDKQSGKDYDRSRYQDMRQIIRDGDLVYLDALDLLGRDYEEIIQEWKYITHEVGADIVCLDYETLFDSRNFKVMDCGKAIEDQFLRLLTYVGKQERKKNGHRQAEGIDNARAEGVTFGRPRKEIDDRFLKVYQNWKAGFITATDAMRQIDMKRTTFYRRVKEIEQKKFLQKS